MNRLTLYGIIALVVVGTVTAAVVGIYSKGYAAGEASVKLAWEKANREQREKEAQQANAAATKLETNRAKDRIIVRTVTQAVDRVVDRVEYRNVCFTPQFLCIANASIAGADAAACRVANPMPSSWETRGWDGRHDLALDYGSGGILSGLLREAPGS